MVHCANTSPYRKETATTRASAEFSPLWQALKVELGKPNADLLFLYNRECLSQWQISEYEKSRA